MWPIKVNPSDHVTKRRFWFAIGVKRCLWLAERFVLISVGTFAQHKTKNSRKIQILDNICELHCRMFSRNFFHCESVEKREFYRYNLEIFWKYSLSNIDFTEIFKQFTLRKIDFTKFFVKDCICKRKRYKKQAFCVVSFEQYFIKKPF